jgi:Trk K+ transport system NAD-binding subunit
MDACPLILVVGGDALADRVSEELRTGEGLDVRVLWPVSPDSDEELRVADVERAAAILTLSNDDGLNLAVALRARMLNPRIRIVLRQFDPLLGTKIEQNLPDCTVFSPAAHSAATYAAAALDEDCLFALRFPAVGGPLLEFTRAAADSLGVSGLTVWEAEKRLHRRILAVGERLEPPGGASIAHGDLVVSFGPVVERQKRRRQHEAVSDPERAAHPLRRLPDTNRIHEAWRGLNPVLRLLIVSAICFFALSFCYFHFVLHKTLAAASFFVVATMTNVGFGDSTVTLQGPLVTAGAITAMLGGIVFTSIFIGYVSSALTRAQWISMQGLRRIRARDRVVICGGGKIGSAVMSLLTAMGKHVIVIDPNPDATLVRRARERDLDLLTGDALRDDALDLCDIPNATAVLALTDNDAVNLEVALAARARSADVPLVVRMENDAFARAAGALFGIATFSPAALTAPVLADLARHPGTRGRVRYAGTEHGVGQRSQGATPQTPSAAYSVPLCVWRGGQLHVIRDFSDMKPFDELLFLVPLRAGRPIDVKGPAPAASRDIETGVS